MIAHARCKKQGVISCGDCEETNLTISWHLCYVLQVGHSYSCLYKYYRLIKLNQCTL